MQNIINQKNVAQHMALAGVCQAATLVKHIAREEPFNPLAFQTSINSIVVTEAQDTEQVFGQISHLELGFSTLVNQLSHQANNKDSEVTRYIANLLGIERKLSGNRALMGKLADRMSQIQRQQAHMDLFEHQMLSNLASIYSDLISPIGAKIQVAGNPALLQKNDNQNKVRALLLAGVRAAVLWRQLGGKRRHILFKRQAILSAGEQALEQIKRQS
ncbi:MAG: high frequency lysogenization protein [Paraglaciecola sp.]|jgi:high frequency lysogenization protein